MSYRENEKPAPAPMPRRIRWHRFYPVGVALVWFAFAITTDLGVFDDMRATSWWAALVCSTLTSFVIAHGMHLHLKGRW